MKPDPSRALEEAFRRIERDSMDGVPILNRALRVQALGFARWNEGWLGLVVSPWFVNVVYVPDADDAGREGEPLFHALPAGTLAFLRAREPEVGAYQTCALSTRMDAFPSHEDALEFARAALQALRQEHQPPAPARPPRASRPLTKRQFLDTLLLRR